MRPVVSRQFATQRLNVIFPRAANDVVMSSPLAGTAIAAMIYIDAIAPDPTANHIAASTDNTATDDTGDITWARPSTCTWISDDILEFDTEDRRLAWRDAAARSRKQVVALMESWGRIFDPAYADNSRETLRDETFKKWKAAGALRRRPGIPTASSRPTWALEAHFADLFDPALDDVAVTEAAEAWRQAHMSRSANFRTEIANLESRSEHGVVVTLPMVGPRTLEPGVASAILKGVIEQWAPARLVKPVVVSISEPGDKLFTGDQQLLAFLKININVSQLLPDTILADVGVDPVQFWIVEAVNTDGEINDARKADFLAWAAAQGIAPEQCSFLTAFRSRNNPVARKRLKDLAVDSYAWFLDEPLLELSWHQVNPEIG